MRYLAKGIDLQNVTESWQRWMPLRLPLILQALQKICFLCLTFAQKQKRCGKKMIHSTFARLAVLTCPPPRSVVRGAMMTGTEERGLLHIAYHDHHTVA